MSDIKTRPFSKNYSGLINQSVIAVVITVICVTSHEVMKRRRRGKHVATENLSSRESWEFGYLFQGRSWAKIPSPPSPAGWPLSWIRQVIKVPETEMLRLRGIDATLYIRFLRGCFWFSALHTLSTFPILFPIHLEFSEDNVSSKSMTRASIASLVGTAKGRSLLWLHICLLFWVTLTWVATLFWICNGAFRLRNERLELLSERVAENDTSCNPHPHPPYGFTDRRVQVDPADNRGLRLRTVMVTNVPRTLRNEKDLKEYFQFYMSRDLKKTTMGITSTSQPGLLNRSFTYIFRRAKKIPAYMASIPFLPRGNEADDSEGDLPSGPCVPSPDDIPNIERVVIVRKMIHLASMLERREALSGLLEAVHIKLARNILLAVKEAMERHRADLPLASGQKKAAEIGRKRRATIANLEDAQMGVDEDARMDQLMKILGPFVEEFQLRESMTLRFRRGLNVFARYLRRTPRLESSKEDVLGVDTISDSPLQSKRHKTVWEALCSLPRSHLDPYQPLIKLSYLFAGKAVPAIDYYTAKLDVLTSLITEDRSKAPNNYDAASTAFVTFSDPADAMRACNYLAVHPNNPLACTVSMAPMYQDLDWTRIMKSSFDAEFVKDWVVNLGVWAFTLFWFFPVSLLVGLVSIQNISLFWPGLKAYLDRHAWQEELIQSLLPTLLVALLVLLVPLILLLIAKKAHNLTTLSAMHDIIMTRYYKFLIVNVLVFFCVGTAALQSLLSSFNPSATAPDVIQLVADSFPTAGPFYVGWLIFTTAIHGGCELALFGLPLILYPTTARQILPRKRASGTRPRTFNFYYWLPNHLLIVHITFLFSVLNPLVIPFSTMYFFVQSGVVKNQLFHVYAKNYENNGKVILIRIVRYSLDGLVLSQAIFLAYMVVLKKTVNIVLSALLILLTAAAKLLMTRMCRAQFELDDIEEASRVCGSLRDGDNKDVPDSTMTKGRSMQETLAPLPIRRRGPSILTWRLPEWVNFSYATVRPHPPPRRKPNPFHPPQLGMEPASEVEPQHLHHSELSQRPPPPLPGPSLAPANGKERRKSNVTDPTTQHMAFIPWDDETTVDLPYDNPFYTRAFDSALWLPRNPFGVLDIDDTIDLKVSLCLDVGTDSLATWTNPDNEAVSSLDLTEDHDIHLAQNPSTSSFQPFNGTEEIDLPPAITQRIQRGDVAMTVRSRRPSTYRRKSSSATVASAEAGTLRRPSVPRRPSFNMNIKTVGRARSSSILTGSWPSYPQNHSQNLEQGSSTRPYATLPPSTTDPDLDVPPPGFPTTVTARQAIFSEVLAEERAAMADQIEDEDYRTTPGKSWFTSWLFRRGE